MNGTEDRVGVWFTAEECKLLSSSLALTEDTLGFSASTGRHPPLSGEEVEMMARLRAKCDAGAGS